MKSSIFIGVGGFFFGFLLASTASAAPPLEVYGDLPTMRSAVISPDGEKVGYISREKDNEAAVVFDLSKDKMMGGVRTDNVKARYMYFPKPDYAVLVASNTTRVFRYRGRLEYSAAFSYNVNNDEFRQLLKGSKELYPAQSGLGNIVGIDPNEDYVFMPGFSGISSARYDLYRVNLKSGRGNVFKSGLSETVDWFVDDDGDVVVREDYDEKTNRYAVYYYEKGSLNVRKIYEDETKIRDVGVVGVKADRSALIVSLRPDKADKYVLAEMSLDGKVSDPIFKKNNAEVHGLVTGLNRTILGVRYSGLRPTYEFFDPKLQKQVESVQRFFPEASVYLVDWSRDLKKMVFSVSGGPTTPAYHLFNADTNGLTRIGQVYNGLVNEDLGKVLTIEYKARDGVKIPSVLTLPPSWKPGEKRPAIIIPHGGPEAYDSVGFDWMAQFFANRGYVVLQPNFRGSSGFGEAFTQAGHGEWGKGVMQHDITDGVQALIKAGYIDPDRICIVGGSYGGYAALAGGAFTPDLYACVAAIAPVSDVHLMLKERKRSFGASSQVLDYWKSFIGDPDKEREKLAAISPSKHADAFKAPVLLIHGNDDLVVPFAQSVVMQSALKKAGKDVTLVKLRGEDHWLSTGETRIETLRALDKFIARIIGGHEASSTQ